MNFLLYFVLRKYFVRLDFSEKEVSLEKGLLLKRVSVMPRAAIIRASVRRTPIMRLFRAKEIALFTLCGKITFFLPSNEPFPPFPECEVFRPKASELLFGAFINTRALGGVFVFSAVLRRFTAIFGSEYWGRLILVLSRTAEELERALKFFHVAVPRITLVISLFALGSWVIAFVRKLLHLSRFSVAVKSGVVYVKSGITTLYEHALVPNSENAPFAVCCESVTALIARRVQVSLHGVMTAPAVKSRELPQLLKAFGINAPKILLRTRTRAFFGHIAAPISWFAVFAVSVIALNITQSSAMLFKTILYAGAIIELYAAVLFLVYMRRSGAAFAAEKIGAGTSRVTARRGLRLYTIIFPEKSALVKISQSVFQRKGRLCNVKLSFAKRRKLTVRQLSESAVRRMLINMPSSGRG